MNHAAAVIACFELSRDQHRQLVREMIDAREAGSKINENAYIHHAACALAATRCVDALTAYANLLEKKQ